MDGEKGNGGDTFWRITSSIGVWLAIVESSLVRFDTCCWRAKASTDLRSIKTASILAFLLCFSFPNKYSKNGRRSKSNLVVEFCSCRLDPSSVPSADHRQ